MESHRIRLIRGVKLAALSAWMGAGLLAPCHAQDQGARAIKEAGDIHGQAMQMGRAIEIKKLKGLYLRCSQESSQRMLGVDESAYCLGLADSLKEREFGGDFTAMMAWWREHRDDDVSTYGIVFEPEEDQANPQRGEED